MQVKDLVQSLLDDNLVETDKIGIGNFLWALPSKARQNRISQLESLKSSIMESKTQKKFLNQFIENQLIEKPETSERITCLDELRSLTEQLNQSTKLKDSLRSCTRVYYDECCEKVKESSEMANLYTDRIFMAKKFLQNKMPHISNSDFSAHFGIPEDLDYI